MLVTLRRIWWAAAVLFFTLAAAWALVTPYNGAYDENDHVVRAAGVVRGQVLIPPSYGRDDGGFVRVPASLVPPHVMCMAVAAAQPPATCLGQPPRDRTLVPEHSRAARYNPVYYVVVGWPLVAFPSMTGVILARLVSAAACAALLASAVVTVWPSRRRRLLLLGLLFAASPMLLSLNGLVNPSGIAIDAAVLLWVVLLRLCGDRPPGPDQTVVGLDRTGPDPDGERPPGPDRTVADAEPDERRLWARCGLAAATIILARPEGVLLVAVVAALVVVAVGRPARRRVPIVSLSVVAAATVAAGGWIVISRVASFGPGPRPIGWPLPDLIQNIVQFNIDYWLRQTVGLFGYGTIGLPQWTYCAWAAVSGALVFAGFGYAERRRLAYTIVAIPVLCVVAGIAADVHMARVLGYWMQGRYILPIWIGSPLLAAWALPALTDTAIARRVYACGTAVWLTTNVLGLAAALTVYRSGKAPGPQWSPPMGRLIPTALLLFGLAGTVLGIHTYLKSRIEVPVHDGAVHS
jgi:hypothetical protein